MKIKNKKIRFFILNFFFGVSFSFNLLNAQNKIISGPSGSGCFGNSVFVLPNGNYVVIDPCFDNALTNVGAVYLYNGSTHKLISTLTGSSNNDYVGWGGITILSNGNYVVRSGEWDNGPIYNAGAVTWCNGITGLNGVVSASNSLVGTSSEDYIGFAGIHVLNNGHYVVSSTRWDNGPAIDAGAVTWCNGTTGKVGTINPSNSLVGSTSSDYIGAVVKVLHNGHYVVTSSSWDNGTAIDAGAVTWCNGTTGFAGLINASNSLVGTSSNDYIGDYDKTTVLSSGNYVVISPNWTNSTVKGAGAVTWCNGSTGRIGAVSASNSLIGSSKGDRVGGGYGIQELPNGNYIVTSPDWANGSAARAGAVTWCNGSTGRIGLVSVSNSLVGSSNNDYVGDAFWGNDRRVAILKNGNYVVSSPNWANGPELEAGAVTWCDGSIGRVGVVSPSNSLVGSTAKDRIGSRGVGVLPNGNYVVISPNWYNGIAFNGGAVTWCNGSIGRFGPVTLSNSLFGFSENDYVGGGGVCVLANGNYVVSSSSWNNGALVDAGAATWCNGDTGRVGEVNINNSLIGLTSDDRIGFKVRSLTNGNYVILSPYFDDGAVIDAGAATWCDGATGRFGTVRNNNSLVGSTAYDQVPYEVEALANGNYVVSSPYWDNGTIKNAGASTWCDGSTGRIGSINPDNSLLGSSAEDQVGLNTIKPIKSGYYAIYSSYWDNSKIIDAQAITIAPDNAEIIGSINNCNSILGNSPSAFAYVNLQYDSVFNYLITSKPGENKIIIRYFSLKDSINRSICANQSYLWNGIARNVPGEYIDTFPSFYGCDSIVILVLKINPLPSPSSFNQTICANQSFHWNGIARNSSGAYKDTFPSFLGCDSIVTLNLTVKPISSSSINQTICASQSFLWNGIARNNSGAYNDTFTSFLGCDSIVTLNLTVNPTSTGGFNQTICANQSFLWNGIARNTSGAFKDTFTSFIGCDSVVTLNLTVTPLPSKLTNTTGNTITAAQAGATYQWINCATNTIIAGAIAQTFIPSINGSFKVVVIQNNCSDTSACVPINSVGLNQNNLSSQVRIYPNPARESLTISLSDEDLNASIILLSLDGKKLQAYPLTQKTNILPISTLAPGFYLYEISFRGNIEKGKLLIQE